MPAGRSRWWLGTFTVLATVATLLGPVSAEAMAVSKQVDPHKIWSPPGTKLPRTPSVKGRAAPGPSKVKPHYKVPAQWAGPASTTVAGGTATVAVPSAVPGGQAATARAGRLPVWVGSVRKQAGAKNSRSAVAAQAAGTPVKVQVATPAVARKTGAKGPVVSVARGTAGPAGQVQLGVDVTSLDAMYGGDAASRSRLVELPACALTSPQKPGCLTRTPIPSHFDAATHRLVADVTIPSATAAAGTMSTDAAPSTNRNVVLAADTTSGGGGGTYAATSLNPSGDWTAGSSSGGFSYSYPIQVPPSLGGGAPQIALSYDSSSQDGLTSSTNSQSSWIGDGWNYSPGFVERSYKSCDKDGLAHSGDMCWGGYNATLSLGGHSSELVRDDTSGAWRLKDDDGSKVEFLSGASNGTSDGEYVKVSTTSGNVYYFGLGHLPGGDGTDPATHSAWTEPVYSPNSTDPCYDSAKGTASWCTMAWRWNLDYSVDPYGNLTTYTYTTQANYYDRGAGQNQGNGTLTSYIRAGALASIAYGQRLADQVAAKGTANAAAKVVFAPAPEGRCSTAGSFTCAGATLSKDNASHWPDVPYDQNCASSGTCTNYGPSFWSDIRLASITTQVWSGGAYTSVDVYTLSQSYPDPNDGNKPTMWLGSIQRTGKDGSPEVSLPPVTFTPVELANRVDGTDLVPAPTSFYRPRIQAITTETGEDIQVDYSLPACSRVNNVMPASADTDTMACYNVKWYPPGSIYGADPASDWFNRYQVDVVTESDPVAHSTAKVTHYTYGAAAWHYNDNELIDPKTRTWDQFRGYATVTATVGSGQDGPVSQTTTKYLQGMDGDHTPSGGSRSVTIPDSLGDHVTDSDWLSGQELETDTFDQAGGSVTAYTVTTATDPVTTSTHSRGSGLPALVARYAATKRTATSKALKADGSWRTVTTTSVGDSGHSNRVISVDTVADGQPEQCTHTSYAISSNALITDLVDETKTLTGDCSAAAGAANTVSDTRTLFNDMAFGSAGATGSPTGTQTLDHYDSAGTPVYVTTATSTYDTYGRPLSTTDPNTTDAQHPNGATTHTTYAAANPGELPSSVTVTSPAPGSTTDWTTTTTFDPGRGTELTSTDVNSRTTTEAYDALGRLIKVWEPGRTTSQNPNVTYDYQVNGSAGPSVVTTSTLQDDAPYYLKSVEYLDGFGRSRQTQATPGVSAYHGRVLTDTFYDSHGRPVVTRSPYYEDAAAPGAGLSTTDPDQVPGDTSTVYDGRGRVTAQIFSSYAVEQWRTSVTYRGIDATDTTPPAGGTPTTVVTDAFGRTAQMWQYTTPTATGHAADADITKFTYTPAGNPATRTDATGQNTWTYTYDLRGRQIKATDPDTGTTTSAYDADGRLASTTDARRVTLSYDYDLLGRKTAEHSTTYPSTTPVLQATWTYDTLSGAKGYPVASTRYVNGDTANPYSSTVVGYDTAYHSLGTTLSIPSSEGALARTYTTQARYDAITGLMSSSHTDARDDLPSETINYTYDINGALSSYGTHDTEYDLSSDYDAFGRAIRTTVNPWGTEIVATDNYDRATGALLTSYLDKQTASTGTTQQITYQRNPAGQVTAIQNIPDNIPSQTDLQCFGYDYLGRLTTAWTDTGGLTTKAQPSVPNIGGCSNSSPTSGAPSGSTTVGGPAPYWTSYSYDKTGNRTGVTQHDLSGNTANDVTTTQTFAPAGQTNQPTTAANTGGGTGGPHALLSTSSTGPNNPGGSAYQYDAIGNTTAVTATSGTTTMAWNAEDRLDSVTATGSSSGTTYVYDADGNQLIRRDPGKTTLTFGNDEITLDTATSTVTDTRTYDLPNGLTAVRQGSTIMWQVADNHGTNTLALDATTLAETRRPLDPFGNPRGTPPASWAGDHGFVGGTQDPATGLTNLGAREYQPATGRFLNPDPLLNAADPQQWNGYAYAGNAPTNSSDPSGLMSKDSSGGSCDGYCIAEQTHLNYCQANPDVMLGCHPGTISYGPIPHTRKDGLNPLFNRFEKGFVDAGAAMVKSVRDTGKDIGNCFTGHCSKVAKDLDYLLDPVTQAKKNYKNLRDTYKGIRNGDPATVAGGLTFDVVASLVFGEAAGRWAPKGMPKDIPTACRLNSFDPSTPVLLGDGTSKAIADLHPGDAVEAADPATGADKGSRTVTATHVHHDNDLVDITVETSPGHTSTIHTTVHHPFWDATRHAWTDAAALTPGHALTTPAGSPVHVIAVTPHPGAADMYNLTVDHLHTYYVLAGETPVLVHNSTPCSPIDLDAASQSGAQADRGGYSYAGRALAKHAGRNGNPNGWPIPSGVRNPAAWNAAGQDMLDEILTNPSSTFTQGYGRISGQWQNTIDVRLPSGLGARFSLNGQFSGFLD